MDAAEPTGPVLSTTPAALRTHEERARARRIELALIEFRDGLEEKARALCPRQRRRGSDRRTDLMACTPAAGPFKTGY